MLTLLLGGGWEDPRATGKDLPGSPFSSAVSSGGILSRRVTSRPAMPVHRCCLQLPSTGPSGVRVKVEGHGLGDQESGIGVKAMPWPRLSQGWGPGLWSHSGLGSGVRELRPHPPYLCPQHTPPPPSGRSGETSRGSETGHRQGELGACEPPTPPTPWVPQAFPRDI